MPGPIMREPHNAVSLFCIVPFHRYFFHIFGGCMRAAMLFAALVCSAVPVFAQGHDHGKLPEVTGGGKFPAGWQARRDDKAAGAELDNVKLVAMGSGLHATVGHTNAVLWNPQNDAKGAFELTATFSQSKANPMHPEGYGLVF